MGKRHWACGILLTASLVNATPATAAISEADRATARKTVEKTFGAQIRQVRMTAEKADDLKTCQLLLQASQDASSPLAVRAELARTAMQIALPIGSASAADLAVQALQAWSTLAGMGQVERGKHLVTIREAELRKAPRGQTRQVAPRLVQAILDLAESYESANDLDNAAAHTFRALGMARTEQLPDLVEELTQANMRIQRVRTFRRDLAAAQKELAAAEAGHNAPLIRKTMEKIGLLHLLRNADAVSASEHLARAKHDWATAAGHLRRRASGARLSVEQSFAAAEMLRDAAYRADLGAKAGLLELLLDLCVELEVRVQGGSDQAARVEVLRKLARTMLSRLPNTSLLALRRVLSKLAGAVVLNPDGTVKLSYSFASGKELNDWTATRGKWTAGKGHLTVGKGGGSIYHNLRFRADRPLSLSFAAAGPGSIIASLALNDDLGDYRRNAHFCAGHQGGTLWYFGGLGGTGRRERLPSRSQPYRIQIHHDGAGGFAYTINGKAVGKLQAAKPLTSGSFRVGFTVSRNRVAAFGALSIHGTPMPKDPVAKPDARPPQAPPSRRPPRTGRPPRRVRAG